MSTDQEVKKFKAKCGKIGFSASFTEDWKNKGPFKARFPLFHGFQDDAKKMQAMARALRRDGWTVLTPTLSPSGCQVGNEVLAQQLSDFIETNVPRDTRCDLVGFSLGAIVCRYYLQRLGGIARVDRFVAISAPEHGTWWASICPAEFLRWPGVAQLRPGSAFLRDLNSDAQVLDRVRFTTMWTPLDLMILPAASSATVRPVFNVTMQGHVWSAYLPEQMAIDYQLKAQVSLISRTVTLSGMHDGYPSYTVTVNGVPTAYYHENFIGDLAGPMDVPFVGEATW